MEPMRLKRLAPKARRMGRPQAQTPKTLQTEGNLLVRLEALKGENTKAPGFWERARALLREAKARWENLSPEERQRLLSLLIWLLALLPPGRLGRVGLLLQKALGPGGEVAFSLLLRLLRR